VQLLPPPDESHGETPAEPLGAEHGLPATAVLAQSVEEARRRFGLSLWLCALIIVADQITKALIRASLAPFESRVIIPGVLDFIHVRNAGVAFGILNDSPMNEQLKAALTTALAGLALVGIAFYARHVHHHEKLARIGLSLILGGAVGNLIDRLRLGYVLDYVDIYWRSWHFWAFNIADASITIGAVLVFIDLLLVTRHAPHPV
jgi:signal peptidase II